MNRLSDGLESYKSDLSRYHGTSCFFLSRRSGLPAGGGSRPKMNVLSCLHVSWRNSSTNHQSNRTKETPLTSSSTPRLPDDGIDIFYHNLSFIDTDVKYIILMEESVAVAAAAAVGLPDWYLIFF